MIKLKEQKKYTDEGIVLYTEADFEGMRRAGRLAADVLDFITPHVVPGVTTEALDTLCHDYITAHNAVPAPLHYKGYPKSTCISINHVVCHGIPSSKKLQNGDIANIDVTVILDGWYGDTSRMYNVGKVNRKAERLVQVTYDCLMAGIEAARPGATLGDIGHVIQTLAEGERFSVVREYCGHGIGREFHTAPSVNHYGLPGTGTVLEPGMIFTIEPMINAGDWRTKILPDNWTAVTRDRSLSAQFEHTIGITETGCEIFTLSPKNYTCPPYNG